jgi:hypothetical protein
MIYLQDGLTPLHEAVIEKQAAAATLLKKVMSALRSSPVCTASINVYYSSYYSPLLRRDGGDVEGSHGSKD